MRKCLEKNNYELYHYVDNKKVLGKNPVMTGDCFGLSGNIENAELTDAERNNGVRISELIN